MTKKPPRLVLVNLPSTCVDDDRLEPSLGQLYVAAAVREAGRADVAYYDMAGFRSDEEAQAMIASVPEAEVYGIGAFCTTHPYAKRLIAYIRHDRPAAKVVMGGANPSAMPEFTLRDAGPDAVVVGEGEDAMADYMEVYQRMRLAKGIIRGVPRDAIDTYPFPARDLADLASYSRRLLGQPVLSVISSRGCPYRCAHCNSVVMGGGAKKVRFRSPENLAREIESLRPYFRHFRFNDDCFTIHPRLDEILKRLADLDIEFRVFACVEHLTAEVCQGLRSAGCVHVSVGLESLDPDNLKCLGKGSQCGKHGLVRFAKDAGITVRSYFMVGLPYDRDETIDHYFSEAAALGLDEFTVYPLIPYPGTRIAMHPEEFGYTIIDQDVSGYVQIGTGGRTCFALRHRNFGPDDVARWKQRGEEILRGGGAVDSRQSSVAV